MDGNHTKGPTCESRPIGSLLDEEMALPSADSERLRRGTGSIVCAWCQRNVSARRAFEMHPRDLPVSAAKAMTAVEREAPEYALAFAKFLVTQVCGLEWVEPNIEPPGTPISVHSVPVSVAVAEEVVDEQFMLNAMRYAVARCGDRVELTVFENGQACTLELSTPMVEQLIDCLRSQ